MNELVNVYGHSIPVITFILYILTGLNCITWLKNKAYIMDKICAVMGLLITPFFMRTLFIYIDLYN